MFSVTLAVVTPSYLNVTTEMKLRGRERTPMMGMYTTLILSIVHQHSGSDAGWNFSTFIDLTSQFSDNLSLPAETIYSRDYQHGLL